MRHRRLRNRWVAAVSLGVAALTMSATIGAGTAVAGPPPAPNIGSSPHWFTGTLNQPVRDVGSDTTFFMMQSLSDLFEQAGLYGCNLGAGGTFTYQTCTGTSDTTDTVDNYDHVEVTTGLGKIGSGDGQSALCGLETLPAVFPDFARSSKPPSKCGDLVGEAYGKDGVPAVTFPGAEGPGTATNASSPWGGEVVGPLAAGWLPAGNAVNGTQDSVTCDTAPPIAADTWNTLNGCHGVPFQDLDGGPASTSSCGYKIYNSGTVTDWMQLTDTNSVATAEACGGTTVPGKLFPIDEPNVNTGSGTVFTFGTFVNATGQVTDLHSNNGEPGTDVVAGTEPGADTLVNGFCHDDPSSIIENNSAQFGDCAAADFPPSGVGADPESVADQAAEISSILYFMSNGVFNSNIHSRIVTLSNGTQYAANKVPDESELPGVPPTPTATCAQDGVTTCTIWNNTFPTARLLYNIYRTGTLRASTADFLDWICDFSTVDHAVDNNTGINYNNEITGDIDTKYGFIRISTLQISGPNANDCPLITAPPSDTGGASVDGTNANELDSTDAGFAQAGATPVQAGDLVTGGGIPANTYVAASPAPTASHIYLVTYPAPTSTTPSPTQTPVDPTLTTSPESISFNIHSPTT